MKSRSEIEEEISTLKRQLEQATSKSSEPARLIEQAQKEQDDSENTSKSLFTLLKYMMDENRRTTTLLKGMYDTLVRLEEELLYLEENPGSRVAEQGVEAPYQNHNQGQQLPQREVPLSEIDARLIQNIQLARAGMACAEDLKAKMNYRGRNAVSARLNRLYRMGLLERHQLGKKVYYKFDAGKTTNTLIISPSQ